MNASIPETPGGAARILPTKMVEKVWGCDSLPAPFTAPPNQKIGEIWFEPPPELPQILAKYLFTSEKLSVQVHPSSTQAQAGEEGKEECWLVLDAAPDARLGIGFRESLSSEAMRAAALDGTIEERLEWHEVRAGDFFHLTPGTVHAIGPGLALVEIQQNSDTTFRLYDYGRPRELHLDRAIDVATGARYMGSPRAHPMDTSACLLDGEHFRLDRIVGMPSADLTRFYQNGLLALPLEGEIGFEDGGHAKAGECVYASALSALDFTRCKVCLLCCPQTS